MRWRPFLLGPIFQAQGWKTSPFEIYPDKGRAARIEEGWGKDFVKRVMHAGFAEDRDIASAEVLDAVLVDVGIEGAAARARATSPERGPALRRATEEAMNLRIFGAPTFLVGEEMFWGNDQLEAAIAWAARGEASRRGA